MSGFCKLGHIYVHMCYWPQKNRRGLHKLMLLCDTTKQTLSSPSNKLTILPEILEQWIHWKPIHAESLIGMPWHAACMHMYSDSHREHFFATNKTSSQIIKSAQTIKGLYERSVS